MTGASSQPPDATTPKARRRRKDARPAELIEAGLREFLDNGYAAARLEDVARRAGASKGTIYRYFADKQALFQACVRSRIGPALDDFPAVVDSFEGSTRALLAHLFATMHRRIVASDMPHLFRIIVAEGGRFPDLAALYHRETVARGAALVERIVARGRARGEVRAGAAADLPIVLIGPALLGVMWRILFQRIAPLDGEALLAAHVDLVCDGLLTDPPQPPLSARSSA
ncbi:MAG: TetR/AcrR family transcriptional regulator [Rhizobiales bacterium]|nr:TetR/AcrR family transcriptional regulator [Hyphomicrobiales bacterium]